MASMAFDHRAAEKLVGLASLDAVCPPEMLAQHKLLELQKIMGGKPLKVGARIDVPGLHRCKTVFRVWGEFRERLEAAKAPKLHCARLLGRSPPQRWSRLPPKSTRRSACTSAMRRHSSRTSMSSATSSSLAGSPRCHPPNPVITMLSRQAHPGATPPARVGAV